MGFTGADRAGLLTDLGVEFDARGNVARDGAYATSVPGVFVAGDMGRGQSLIVWAIAEGRSAAAAVDTYLEGDSMLPAPIPPTRPLPDLTPAAGRAPAGAPALPRRSLAVSRRGAVRETVGPRHSAAPARMRPPAEAPRLATPTFAAGTLGRRSARPRPGVR